MASTTEDLNAISTVNEDGSQNSLPDDGEWLDLIPAKEPVIIRGAGNVTV